MRTFPILLLLAGFSFNNTDAQLAFGLKGGLNSSTVSGSEIQGGATSLVGFNAGAYLTIPVIVQHLSLQPEVVYSTQGFKGAIEGVPTTQHIDYLNVPILFKYSIAGVFIETGPQLGILINANAKALGETTGNKASFYAADWAWVFGAGIRIPMTPVSIDARYNFGMANIIYENENNGNMLNGTFQLDVLVDLFTSPAR